MHPLDYYLKQNAELYKNQVAFETYGASITYSEFYESVLIKANSFHASGKEAVILKGESTIDFLVDYFAAHKAGLVAVIVSANESDSNISRIEKKLKGIRFREGISDILFTTGSTGTPKGVMISKTALASIAENLVIGLKFHHDLNFIVAGPLSHLGCISKIYAIVMSGATCTMLKSMKNLDLFFNVIESSTYKVATFMVPSNIKILCTFCKEQLRKHADKIEFIETGADTLDLSTMEKIHGLLPRTLLYNTYATTETGVVSTFEFSHDLQEGCLGKSLKNSAFSITDEGRIKCFGKTIMSGYIFFDENVTCEYLREDSFETADLGMIDENGMLHFHCRKDDIINTGGFKVNPIEVENAANGLDGISESICVAVPHVILNKALKLIYKKSGDKPADKGWVARKLSESLESYKVPLYYEIVDEITHTFNGKVDRKLYKAKEGIWSK